MCVWIFVGCRHEKPKKLFRSWLRALKTWNVRRSSLKDPDVQVFNTKTQKNYSPRWGFFNVQPWQHEDHAWCFLYYKETVSRFWNTIRIGIHYITPVPTGLQLHVNTHPQLAMKAAAVHAATRIRFCGMLFSKHLLQGFLNGSLDQTFLGWDDRMKVIFNSWMLVWVKH